MAKHEETPEQLEVLHLIMSTVSKATFIPIHFIKSKWRKREVVIARQMYHYYANKYTKCSLASIAKVTHSPSHSSVIHSRGEVIKILENKELPYYIWTEKIEGIMFSKLQYINNPKERVVNLIAAMKDEYDTATFYEQLIEALQADLEYVRASDDIKGPKEVAILGIREHMYDYLKPISNELIQDRQQEEDTST